MHALAPFLLLHIAPPHESADRAAAAETPYPWSSRTAAAGGTAPCCSALCLAPGAPAPAETTQTLASEPGIGSSHCSCGVF